MFKCFYRKSFVGRKSQNILLYFCIAGNVEMTLKLIQSGADPNAFDHNRMTPLDHCIMLGRCRPTGNDIIPMILMAGAKIALTRLAANNQHSSLTSIIMSRFSHVHPMKLSHLCRICIRKHLNVDVTMKVESLPLPQPLKDYLVFKVLE